MRRTDLALEIRESIVGEQEVEGVVLTEEKLEKEKIKISTVKILNEQGSKKMGRKKGAYITIEGNLDASKEKMVEVLKKQLKNMLGEKNRIMVVGLGNRNITPDALGPWTIDRLDITRHLIQEFGEEFRVKYGLANISAIAPGVMAQTGIETKEILQGTIKNVKPDAVIVVDALAARSVHRTIQLTDTGISPGAGVGNNRKELNEDTLGVTVVAMGVPTVVDAETIVEDRVEECLHKAGCSGKEIGIFLKNMHQFGVKNMFVTTKEVDEQVREMSEILSEAINTYQG